MHRGGDRPFETTVGGNVTESPTEQPGESAGRGEDETTLAAGAPGPSGTGEMTQAGGDPAAATQQEDQA